MERGENIRNLLSKFADHVDEQKGLFIFPTDSGTEKQGRLAREGHTNNGKAVDEQAQPLTIFNRSSKFREMI